MKVVLVHAEAPGGVLFPALDTGQFWKNLQTKAKMEWESSLKEREV